MNRGDEEFITLSISAGASEHRSISFSPGEPVGTFSIGTDGKWKVVAQGVGPQHVYVAFDGRNVYASASLRATLAGAALPAGSWTHARPPCELRFGDACIVMSRTRHAGSPGLEAPTVCDGGELYQAAQRAVAAAMRGTPPPQGGAAHPPLHGADRRNAGLATVRVPKAMSPPTAPPTGVPRADGFHAARQRPAPSTSPPRHPVFDAPARPPRSPSPGWTQGPYPTVIDAGPETPPAGAIPRAGAFATAAQRWRSASTLERVAVILMPLTVAGAVALVRGPTSEAPGDREGSPPPRTSAMASGPSATGAPRAISIAPIESDETPQTMPMTAHAAPFAVESRAEPSPRTARGAAVGIDTNGANAAPEPASAPIQAVAPALHSPGPTGGRTPEREAIDAVAAGSLDEAARRYQDLAAAHPGNTAFSTAAHVLQKKVARGVNH